MATRVLIPDATIENWCPQCAGFHFGPKHYPYKLRLIIGGKPSPLLREPRQRRRRRRS
jgi:hypothetical protein